MAYNYIDTPRTDAGDRTHLTAANISFSEVQGYPSPSKDPNNNLVGQLRSRGGGQALKTPRARNALASLRAGGKNEFTPLLKSAAANRFRTNSRSPRKGSNGKENAADELVNSMLAQSIQQAPQTPAYLRAGYKGTSRTPGLPVDSSVLDGDVSRTSLAAGTTPGPPPAISSSTLMSTPIPAMPSRTNEGRADQGNVLTLREQEAKLAKLDKENFNLKLKIHFLDEALKRSGTEYQQGMIKENTELKMDKTTMTYEIKQQQKSILRAEKELEEYRIQLREYAEKVKRRHTDEIMKEEMQRLQKLAEDNQAVAEERDQEIDELNKRLELAEQGGGEKFQEMRDDIADLEQELRAKEQELDAKDDEIEGLHDKLKTANGQGEEFEGMKEDIASLEAELEEKDAALAGRDEEIAELRSQVRNTQDREKSTKKLRGDVDMLEAEIREKNEVIDEKHEELRSLQKRLQAIESQSAADLQTKTAELRDKDRVLEDKNGEIKALEDRLKTARGSWDAEAQQTDARLQEKDNIIQERDSQLREKARIIDEKEDALRDLRRQVESKESENKDVTAQQEKQSVQKNVQIYELQEKLRTANSELDFHIDKKNGEIQKIRKELEAAQQEVQKMQERIDSRGSPTKKDGLINEQASQIRELETKLQTAMEEKEADLEEMDRQLVAAETEIETYKTRLSQLSASPTRNNRITQLQQELEQARADKEALDDEIIVLETNLEEAQNERLALEKTVAALRQDLEARPSDSTPVRERNELRLRLRVVEQQAEDYKQQVTLLEAELDKAWKAKSSAATPARERTELRSKLAESEAKAERLEQRIVELESDTRRVRDDTISGERRDLHNMLRDAQIEIEELQEQVKEKDARVAVLVRKEGESRALLGQSRGERDDAAADIAERDARIAALMTREKELRSQVQELRSARREVEDLEERLGEKKGSSSGHARREAELRSELRDVKLEVEDLRSQVHQRDDRLQAAVRKEQQLRERIKKTRQVSEETELFGQDLNAQLNEAEMAVQTLQTQLKDRERKLAASAKRESELKGRMKGLRAELRGLEEVGEAKATNVSGKTHEKELRGLTKQIQYLRAKCGREESFRRDLVFVKRWFTLQVQMYGACNKADLKMLEEMGITPDLTVRERRPSLKAAGQAIIATIRMRKMQQAWAGNKKLHESLLKKLETMQSRTA
ncbi:Spindle pole body protein pcp1 [Sphaceloma murrayae]|uniref:Spindle pole body protein pcp1 n=1 Tax=Sphaceloma murrayae TaxID=2082308 RepID=A0A2K1R259_9PEZI|nr:Spindle pole body protein pcp1 [Sphaceloma murrayae]